LLEFDRADVRVDGTAAPGLDQLVNRAVEACVRMATTGGHLTRARYELALHAIRTPSLHREFVAAGTQLRALIAGVLDGLGVPDPERAAEEIAAVLDGLVFTALVRGPHEPTALREWLRPPLRRVLSAYLRCD
jgi:hypothetical protein